MRQSITKVTGDEKTTKIEFRSPHGGTFQGAAGTGIYQMGHNLKGESKVTFTYKPTSETFSQTVTDPDTNSKWDEWSHTIDCAYNAEFFAQFEILGESDAVIPTSPCPPVKSTDPPAKSSDPPAKTTDHTVRNALLVGGGIVGIAVVIFIVFMVRKNKNKTKPPVA
jgi:hypothetical protein